MKAKNWKKQIKAVIPKPVLERITEFRFRRLNRRVDAKFAGEDAGEVFSNIYKSGIWGEKEGTDFYSGGGSHNPQLVDPYIKAVVGFLSSLQSKPSAVDLGCGDFNVGSQIRPYCERYTACDVVQGLVDHNRTKFEDLDVSFCCLNAVTDDLPDGDVVFLREVLQHLSNSQIAQVLGKLTKYRFLVLSESLPARAGFVANLEKKTGPGLRIASGSGVVLTDPPFSIAFIKEQHLCVVKNETTQIRTTLYQLH